MSHRLSLLALVLFSASARALPPTDLFSRFGPAVVVLETYDSAGERLGSLTATTVAREKLVTVCDAIETAAALRVLAKAGKLEAIPEARDRERNLCLLSVPGLDTSPLDVATGAPAVGSRGYAVSNALGLGVGISDGVIAAVRSFSVGNYIQFTAPISPGSEGGALIDEEGRLLGIVDYRRRDGQNVNFAPLAAWIGEIASRAAADAPKLQRLDRATVLVGEKNWAELKQLAESWSAAEPTSVDPWRYFIRGVREQGDAEAELRGWRALYRLDTTAAAGIGLGGQLLVRKQHAEASELAQRQVNQHPADAASWHLLGLTQQAQGKLDDAEKSFSRAVELDPWLLDAYQSMARLAQGRGNTAASIAIWRRLAGLRPNDINVRLGLVNAYLAAGKAGKAWATLGRLSDMQADDALAWYWKGVTLAALGAPEQAAVAYRKSLERKPPVTEWPWGGLGLARLEQRRLPEAIAAFREARQANPTSEQWTYQLLIPLKDGGHLEEALKISSDLITRYPNEARYWRQHGFVLSILDRPAEAIPAYERTLHLEPRQGKVWAAMIEACQQTNKQPEARRAYETLRGIDGAMAEAAYRKAILPYEERRP